MAIAVKLIEQGLDKDVSSITLFAGDRDFFDAIKYVSSTLAKPTFLIGFRTNFSKRLQ